MLVYSLPSSPPPVGLWILHERYILINDEEMDMAIFDQKVPFPFQPKQKFIIILK